MTRKKTRKRILYKDLYLRYKNRTALVIVLFGALCGSLFVDITQMVRGAGFTDRALRTTSVITHDGRTWVAYKEPIIPLTVIVDTACKTCRQDALVAWLQYTIPTVRVETVDYRTSRARDLMQTYNLVSVPSVIFDDSVVRTNFFAGTKDLFAQSGDRYIFDIASLNIVPTRYVRVPDATDAIVVPAAGESAMTVTAVGNFTCRTCAQTQRVLRNALARRDDLRYVFVYAPNGDDDARGDRAVEAVYCAAAQGRFIPYATALFGAQRWWQSASGDQVFVALARRAGVPDRADFAACLRDGRYREQRAKSAQQGRRYSAQGLPVIFVGDAVVDDADALAAALKQ